jgi:Uncharacterized protein conserved in bacteria (DUF2252)
MQTWLPIELKRGLFWAHSAEKTQLKCMNIRDATKSYEQWMRKCTVVVETDLRSKHEQMRENPFLFFRGTFYRWAQLWPELCADLCNAPAVLAVGDLHVDSFGTWRDGEGRLSWGVDDFDESCPLPYTNDLVRLAASVKMVIDCEDLALKLRDGCDAVLDGYQETLKTGGSPFVLAEHKKNMEKLGIDAIKTPDRFWEKLDKLPAVRHNLPSDAKRVLQKTLPASGLDYKVVRRAAGLGSLGQQRFVAIAKWEGGLIAREAKAMLPSARMWVNGHVGRCQSYYPKAIRAAIRSHDPFQKIVGTWLIRRLSPEANPIYIADLPKERDEERLLHAMGAEAANVHLGSKRQVKNIGKDLRGRKANWLRSAAKKMAKGLEHDWKEYRDR